MPEQYEFTQIASSDNYDLYAGENSDGTNKAWTGYIVSSQLHLESTDTIVKPPATLSFSDSWTKYSGNPLGKMQGGCYIFCRQAPSDTSQFMTLMVSLLQNLTKVEAVAYRYILWIDNPDIATIQDLIYNLLPFTTTDDEGLSGLIANQTQSPLRNNAVSFGNIYLQLPANTEIEVSPANNTIQINQFSNGIKLWNSNTASFGKVDGNITLSLTERPGALIFPALFNTQSVNGDDFSTMEAGIRYFIAGDNNDAIAQRYPLWAVMHDNVSYKMAASLDPLWPEAHDRTYFQFSAPVKPADRLDPFLSSFSTNYGHALTLRPIALNAKLVFMAGLLNSEKQPRDQTELFGLAPAGDFIISTVEMPGIKEMTAADNTNKAVLLCGLNGSETFSFTSEQEDPAKAMVLSFITDQPAYAANFPFAQASPVGAPIDPSALLLNDDLKTSWVVLNSQAKSGVSQYAALPKGSPLYGFDNLIHTPSYSNFLGFVDPGYEIPLHDDNFPFPMVPYSAIEQTESQWEQNQIETFERQIIAPVRRMKIAASNPEFSPATRTIASNDSDTMDATTPSGQIVTLNNNTGQWTNILLGQLSSPSSSSLYFSEPAPTLQQAFQTSDLMLVVADPKNLGTLLGIDGISDNVDGAAFANSLNIENWLLEAQVGENYSYGDYSNIVIVKGLKGKLFDPDSTKSSLISNPKKWTQSADFSAPNGKQDELVTLSTWLWKYFDDAASKTGDDAMYFDNFNKMAQDENWTGILVLRAHIAGIPQQIKGIAAGVENPSAFNAHHFGVNINQTTIGENGPKIKGDSSVFGLIYYNDPAWVSTKPQTPVAPTADATYDFRLLDLKVLFENSTVKHFQSYAQLTLNKLFGSKVASMGEGGNVYNSLILQGSFQDNGGAPVYSLGTVQDYVFLMENNIYNKIEISSAQMSTLSATEQETLVWFGLTGYLDFKILQQSSANDGLEIDLLSFGSEDGKTLRKGLNFSNMGLSMDYPTLLPEEKTFALTTQDIRFDIQSSTIRKNSLYRSFSLSIEALTTGNAKSSPANQGFLNVITDLRLSGVDGRDWHGLKYRLNLGTPGELAGKIGLNADLLISWSDQGGKDDNYKINVGLHLPGTTGGASLISLQNVLKLSFGPIRLLYAKQSEDSEERNFMLMLTSIALKFLGLMKIPPNGNTNFYLFGNPESDGKASGLGWYAKYGKVGKDGK